VLRSISPPDKGFSGNAIRLDINFVAGAGYAIIQKRIPISLLLNQAHPAELDLLFCKSLANGL